MLLRLSDDESTIDEVFGAFFANECATERVRAAAPLGFDSEAWARLAQTGAPGMALSEAAGGGGASLSAAAVVAAQLGRHIAPVPLIEHLAAARLLERLAPGHPRLEEVVSGDQIITLALNGDHLVPAGAVAHLIVHTSGDEVALTETEPPGSGPRNSADLPLANRALDSGTVIGGPGWPRAVAEWQALMATALAGLGRRATEIGVDYVKERTQFGVPVGSFQAVQHGLASAITAIEGATHLSSRAVWALDTGQPDAETLAAMALLFCAEAAQAATAASLQYHGGYGYAEEYDIQLYHRRAKGWALQYGDPGAEYQRLAADLLPEAG